MCHNRASTRFVSFLDFRQSVEFILKLKDGSTQDLREYRIFSLVHPPNTTFLSYQLFFEYTTIQASSFFKLVVVVTVANFNNDVGAEATTVADTVFDSAFECCFVVNVFHNCNPFLL